MAVLKSFFLSNGGKCFKSGTKCLSNNEKTNNVLRLSRENFQNGDLDFYFFTKCRNNGFLGCYRLQRYCYKKTNYPGGIFNYEVSSTAPSIKHLCFFKTYLKAAKTKFTKNYKGKSQITTVGLNIGKIYVAGICLNLWDLGGQEELQSLWDKIRMELDRSVQSIII